MAQAFLQAILAVLRTTTIPAAVKLHLHLIRAFLDLLAQASAQAPAGLLLPALLELATRLHSAYARQALAAVLRTFATAVPATSAAVLGLLPTLLSKAAAAAGPAGKRTGCAVTAQRKCYLTAPHTHAKPLLVVH